MHKAPADRSQDHVNGITVASLGVTGTSFSKDFTLWVCWVLTDRDLQKLLAFDGGKRTPSLIRADD